MISVLVDDKELDRKLTLLDKDLTELGKIDTSHNIAKIDVLLAKLAQKYSQGETAITGITEAKLKTYYSHYRRSDNSDSKKYLLKDILNVKDQRRELVRGLIPQGGLTLVGAQPKTGKSLLMYELVYCLLTNTPFLGYTTKECNKVVFYQLEEPKPTINTRLKTRGFQEAIEDYSWNETGKDLVILRSLQLVGKGLQDIKKVVEDESPDLLIIDSLRAATYTSNISENSAEWATPLYFLQNLCKEYDVTIIVIHHFNKAASNGNTQGTINDFAGTSAITGNCDMMIMLYRDIEYDNLIKIKTIPREGETITCKVKRVLEEGERFKYVRVVSDSNDTQNLLIETLILYYLYPDKKLTKVELANKIYTTIQYDEDSYTKILSGLYSSGVVDTKREKNGTEVNWYYFIKDEIKESGDYVLFLVKMLYKIVYYYNNKKDIKSYWNEIQKEQGNERVSLLREALDTIDTEILNEIEGQ